MHMDDPMIIDDSHTDETAPPSRAALSAALVAAQRAAVGVHKSSRNSFHKYDYASAEQIIWVATKALTGAGLALICIASEITGEGQLYLRRHFDLIHEGGGSKVLSQVWPIVPEKGRPLDKAVAAADTAGLGYLLRSLLLLPRVEKGTDLDEPRGDEHRRGGLHEAPDIEARSWVASVAHMFKVSTGQIEAILGEAGRDWREIPMDKRGAAESWLRERVGAK